MSDKPVSDAAFETVVIATSGDAGEGKAVTQPATIPVTPKNTALPRKPEQRRVRMLAEDPDLSAEIYELQGSYGFPRDKKKNIRKMTLEEGPKWLEEARALKATNLKEMDDKLQKRVVDAVANAMQPVLEKLEKRMTAHANAIDAFVKAQAKSSSEEEDSSEPDESIKEELPLWAVMLVTCGIVAVIAACGWLFLI